VTVVPRLCQYDCGHEYEHKQCGQVPDGERGRGLGPRSTVRMGVYALWLARRCDS
jgi:hypothetical protein